MPGEVASRTPGPFMEKAVDFAPRSRLALGFLALICGLGIAASGVTLVRAADDAGMLDFFRSERLHRLVDPLRLRPRYEPDPSFVYRPPGEVRRRQARAQAKREARLREVRRAAPRRPRVSRVADARRARPSEIPARALAVRPANVALAAASPPSGRRTMCVRTCDGYLFPIGTLHSRADLDTHQTACSAACPGTETRLYTLTGGRQLEDPSGARSVLDGTVYARLKTAFLFRKKTVASCDCQPPGRIASHLPILLDPTLRRGDVVVDARGAATAFAGPSRMPRQAKAFADYEGSGVLSHRTKAKVDRLMGTSVRRRIAADYERSERRRLAGLQPAAPAAAEPARGPVRDGAYASLGREVRPPAGTGTGIRAYSFGQGRTVHASGATIIAVP